MTTHALIHGDPRRHPEDIARLKARVAELEGAKPWVTFRLASGEPVYGEFAYVDGPEFFEGVDRPTAVIKETWALLSAETIVFGEEPA